VITKISRTIVAAMLLWTGVATGAGPSSGSVAPPGASTVPRDRVDSTLPALESPGRGERVLSTRPQRAASEARLRDELIRQAEIDRLVNPYRDPWSAGMPVVPSVFPQVGVGGVWPCPGCGGWAGPPGPLPPGPHPPQAWPAPGLPDGKPIPPKPVPRPAPPPSRY
jgi:hypothetical protein